MRIGPDDGEVGLFNKEVHFGIRDLFFETSDYRGCKYNIPYGTKPYDQVFYQEKSFRATSDWADRFIYLGY